MISRKDFKLFLLDCFVFIVSFLAIITIDNIDEIPIIGLFIIFLSLVSIVKVKKNKKLLLLMSIIGFINISIAVTDLIYLGVSVAQWQLPIRGSVYNIQAAKSILIFLATLNFFLNSSLIDKSLKRHKSHNARKRNKYIAYTGIIAIYLILFYGIITLLPSRQSGYVSVSNPMYEYSVVAFAVIYYYSRGIRWIEKAMFVYVVIYMGFFFIIGDRSAAFMLGVLYFLINFENLLNLKRIAILSVLAVLVSNIISIFRKTSSFNFETIIDGILEKGLYSDTISYAYYASITITALNKLTDNQMFLFLKYIQSIFLGTNEYSVLSKYSTRMFDNLYNLGGGIFPTYFYAWFGYLGVVVSGILIGLIIKKVYTSNNDYFVIFQVLIPAFSLRWYLYAPTTLFRSIFVLTAMFLMLIKIIEILTTRSYARKKLI